MGSIPLQNIWTDIEHNSSILLSNLYIATENYSKLIVMIKLVIVNVKNTM